MGTFIKYIFYAIIIVLFYIVGKGIFEGQINEQTTVGEVMNNVETNAKNMVKNTEKDMDNEIKKYDEHPKKEINMAPNQNKNSQ